MELLEANQVRLILNIVSKCRCCVDLLYLTTVYSLQPLHDTIAVGTIFTSKVITSDFLFNCASDRDSKGTLCYSTFNFAYWGTISASNQPFRDGGRNPFSTFLCEDASTRTKLTKKWKTVFDHRHEKSWHLKAVQDRSLRF